MNRPLQEDDFDLRTRAELSLAFDPGIAPQSLFRHTPLLQRRAIQILLVVVLLFTGVFSGVSVMRPP
ncbi:MAG: hypothetical protein OEW36_11365, partial [Hylemonella sp.]|nr:hypothetical protein [Hylemonella sp.]